MRCRKEILVIGLIAWTSCAAPHIRDLSLDPAGAPAQRAKIPLEIAYFMDEKDLRTTEVAALGEAGNVRIAVGRLVDSSFRETLAGVFQAVSVPEASPFSKPQWTFDYPGYIIPSIRSVAVNGANQETQLSVIVSFYMKGRRKVGEAFLQAKSSRFTIDQGRLSEAERKEFAAGSRDAILGMSMRQTVRNICEQLVQARKDLLATAPYQGGLVLAGPLLFPLGIDFEPANSTRLVPNALSDLEKVATILRKHPSARIRIEVHAFDYLGKVGEKLPKDLSRERASILRKFLEQADIAPTRIDTAAMEDFYPIGEIDLEAGWDKNDRIDFVLLK